MNLLKETIDILEHNGKSESDVAWCGSEEFGWFTWDKFKELADYDYDDGYGAAQVCEDLLIVGKDFWLERHEYDGAESWQFKKTPTKPSNHATPVIVVDDSFMWQTLEESNRPGGKYGNK